MNVKKIKLNVFNNNKLKFNLEPRTLKSNWYVSGNCYDSSELLRYKGTVTIQLNCYDFCNLYVLCNCYVSSEVLQYN